MGDFMNWMEIANKEAKLNMERNFSEGGPFGACIVKDGKIVSKARNMVLLKKDPTAHAEINAIRSACLKLGTHDLSGCEIYTTCEPCPMCLSAIIWANIKVIYYANSKEDAANIGFRDEMIYEHLAGNDIGLDIRVMDKSETILVFDEFSKNQNLY